MVWRPRDDWRFPVSNYRERSSQEDHTEACSLCFVPPAVRSTYTQVLVQTVSKFSRATLFPSPYRAGLIGPSERFAEGDMLFLTNMWTLKRNVERLDTWTDMCTPRMDIEAHCRGSFTRWWLLPRGVRVFYVCGKWCERVRWESQPATDRGERGL